MKCGTAERLYRLHSQTDVSSDLRSVPFLAGGLGRTVVSLNLSIFFSEE